MKINLFIRFLFIFLIAGCSNVQSQKKTITAGESKLPNIIYIYADDLGIGELGSYGQTKIKTPHLDQMAREGMRFTNHYASAPVCAPARGMLMTGKHAGHAYIRGNYELGGFPDSLERGQMPLPEGAYTLPKMLKKQVIQLVQLVNGDWEWQIVLEIPTNKGLIIFMDC